MQVSRDGALASRLRRGAVALVFAAVLLADSNRGLVLPTLVVRLHGDAAAVGAANAGFSAARLLAAPAFGAWQDARCAAEPLVLAATVGALSNAAYVLARSDGGVVAARAALGVGSSVLGVGRAVVAAATAPEDRTPALALLAALQFVGFTLASAAAALPGLPARVRVPGGPVLDAARAPGAFLAAAHLALLAALLCAPSGLWAPPPGAEAPPVASLCEEEANDTGVGDVSNDAESGGAGACGVAGDGVGAVTPQQAYSSASDALAAPLLLRARRGGGAAAAARAERRRVLLVTAALSAANGGTRLALAVLETVGPSIFYALWAAAHPEAKEGTVLHHRLLRRHHATPSASASPAAIHAGALFWGGVGLLGLLAFGGLYVASRRGASDRALLACGAVLCAAGCALAASADATAGGPAAMLLRFQCGVALAWGVGFPLAQAAAVAALAKAVPPARLGTAMAAQAVAGSAGRVVGPLLAGALYGNGLQGGARALQAAAAAAAAAGALVAAMWRML